MTKFDLHNHFNETHASTFQYGCDCLFACSHIRYITTVNEISYNCNKTHILTTLYVRYRNTDFNTLRREEMYPWDVMVSGWGGLLGLFLGSSLISLLEINFYFIFRLAGKLFRRKKTNSNILRKRYADRAKYIIVMASNRNNTMRSNFRSQTNRKHIFHYYE